jgi:hypothetical protein
MKIKDLKSKKVVSEIQLSSFGLGDYGSALGKQLVGKGGGLTKQDLMTQNIYIKNFVSNALSNLNNAIKSGLVDPKKVDPRKATAADFPTTKQMQPGDLGDYNLKDKLAQQQKDKQQAAINQAQAAKDKQASDAAQAKINKAAAASASPAATAAADARVARAQQSQATQPTSVSDKLDKAAAQRGQTPYTQTKQNTPGNTPPMPRVRESSYNRLNALFESIMETVVPQQSNTQSVKDYLKTVWLPGYLKGVNWKPNEQQIDKILQQVQDTYAKDGGRGALNQLASLSFSITPRSQPKTKKQKIAKPAAEPAAKAAADDDAIVATWGGVKYTKTMSGWKDKNGKLADENTAKILDQAVTKSKEEPNPTKPKGPAAPTAGPAAGAAQQAEPASNVVSINKNKKVA